MAEGIVREDCIVDIVDIDVSMAKFGTTIDTPGHIEQPIATVRVRLEGYTVNGDSRPWVDLRSTIEGWKKINEALQLAVKSKEGAKTIKEIKERRRYLKGLPPKPGEKQIHESPK